MKIRDIISTIHMPYRKVMYVAACCGVVAMFATDWLPIQFFFIKFISISLIFAVMLYFSFWMYRAGYRMQALLIAILSLALFATSIVIMVWVQKNLAIFGSRL